MMHVGRIALVSLLTAFAAGATSGLTAQDGPVDSAGPVDGADSLGSTERFEAVYDSVLSLTADIEAMDRWIEASSGSNRQLLAQRRDVRIEARRDLLARLAGSAADSALTDSVSIARISQADSLLATDIVEQRTAIVSMIDDASIRRAELDGLEGTERARLASEVRRIERRLDAALTSYLTALTHRADLGSEVTAELQDLDDFLRLRAEILAARMADMEEDIGLLRQRLSNGETGLETEVAGVSGKVDNRTRGASRAGAAAQMRGRRGGR